MADEAAPVDLAQAKGRFGAYAQELDDTVAAAQHALDRAYAFLDEAFGIGKETLLFTTDISADASVVSFIGRYGSESYRVHSRDLMLEERAAALQERAMKAAEAR